MVLKAVRDKADQAWTTTKKLLSQGRQLDNSLYIIYGDQDSPKVVDNVPVFLKQLKANMPEGLRLEQVILPGEGHVPDSSLPRGMKWIFSDVEGSPRGTD